MAENSKIEWTHHTFNPWIGCTKVAAGCTNCYAERDMDHRYHKAKWGPHGTRVKTSRPYWRQPIKWDREAERYPDECAKCGVRLNAGSQFQIGNDTCPSQRNAEGKFDPTVPMCGGEIRRNVRPRVFCASLADWAEDWPGDVVDSNGNKLYVVPRKPARPHDWPTSYGIMGDGMMLGDPATLDDFRRDLFALIDATRNLDWLLLTKRPENILRMWVPRFVPHPSRNDSVAVHRRRDNAWLLTSIAEQKDADRNLPELFKCHNLAPVLGVSAEPLLSLLNLDSYLPGMWHCRSCNHWMRNRASSSVAIDDNGSPQCSKCNSCNVELIALHWVIGGGESGPDARIMPPDAIRSLRDQCQAAGVPFLFKQWGEWAPAGDDRPATFGYYTERVIGGVPMHRFGKHKSGRMLDGVIHNAFPQPLTG